MTQKIEEAFRNGQVTSIISQYEMEWGRIMIETFMKARDGEAIPAFINTGVFEPGQVQKLTAP